MTDFPAYTLGLTLVSSVQPGDMVAITRGTTEYRIAASTLAGGGGAVLPVSAPLLGTDGNGTAGAVAIGTGLSLSSGTLSCTYSYTLPTASTSVLGGVKVDGSTITIDGAGIISSTGGGGGGYTLPAATSSVRGGITVSTGLSISGDALSVAYGTSGTTAAAGNDSRITGALSASTAASTYAPLASPALTGTPTAPTASAGTNTTQLATTAYVQASYAAPPALGSTTPAAVTGTTVVGTTSVAATGAANTLTLSGSATGTPVRLVASGSDTNVGVVVAPKGSGAITAQVPDSGNSGGNARGVNAIDFQQSRYSAGQVASGAQSFLGAGRWNTASGTFAAVVSGSESTASGGYSFLGGGNQNSVSGGYAGLVGGQSNTISGSYGSGWAGNAASDRGRYSSVAWASGAFSAAGDAQRGEFLLRASATTTSTARLTADGGGAGSANIVNIPNNTAYLIASIEVIARDTSTGDVASWILSPGTPIALTRGSNAASTTLRGTPSWNAGTNTGGGAVAGMSSPTLTADTTNGGINLSVAAGATPAAALHVVARVVTVEVQ